MIFPSNIYLFFLFKPEPKSWLGLRRSLFLSPLKELFLLLSLLLLLLLLLLLIPRLDDNKMVEVDKVSKRQQTLFETQITGGGETVDRQLSDGGSCCGY